MMQTFGTGSIGWISSQLALIKPAKRNVLAGQQRGFINAGYSTAAVFDLLREHRGRYFTADEIIRATGRTRKGVSWALFYLKRHGLVDTAVDVRNPRYLRYRVV